MATGFRVLVLIGFVALATSSVRKAAADAAEREVLEKQASGETEVAPGKNEVTEDCIAFVGRTKSAVKDANGACPTCPAGSEMTDVFAVKEITVDKVSCAGDSCEAAATIRAIFNSSTGHPIVGGLVGWIQEKDRMKWLKGETPAAEQAYKVKITYRREGDEWRAIEFDRAAP